jgi:AraC-like DNA-binding protein
MKMSVNLTEVELASGMIYMNIPGNIVCLNEIVGDPDQEIRVLCMALTKEFFQGLNVEICKLFNEGISMLEKPCMQLSEKDFQLADNLIRYIINLLQTDVAYKKEAILSALSSLFYILIGAWTSETAGSAPAVLSNRSKVIFDKFMRLVMDYHTQYRNVGFYAEKLCLTPKYLSKIIKTATGRSAPEWIDSYVILEAKNLLKHSTTPIKEIVFKLNFPNQSVFYKFFKAHTGMTPTEYRNS